MPSSPAPAEPAHRDFVSPITVNDLRVLAWHYDIDRAIALQKRLDLSKQPSFPLLPEDDGSPMKRRKMSVSVPSNDDTLTPLPPSSYAHIVNLTSTAAAMAPPPHPPTSELETTSTLTSNLAINSRTRLTPTLSPPATTKSRTRSPPRNMLNEIRGVVDCDPGSDEAKIPASVHELRRTLVRGFGVRVIPGQLREPLRKMSPAAYEDIPEYAFDDESRLSEAEAGRLWWTVCGISRAAGECKVYSKDENAWCMSVVREVLLVGIDTPGNAPTIPYSERADAPEPSILELNSVQSQSLDSRFLPTLRSTNQAVSRKADFALSFNAAHPRVHRLYSRVSFGGLNLQLSPTTDDYTMRLAAFAGVEVKTASGNTGEGLTQLAIWMAASLNNLLMLQDLGGGETAAAAGLMPIAGWVVHEHHWDFYIGHKNLLDGGKVTVLGPFGSLKAGTDTYYDIFKLVDLVRRLHGYAREVYWPWLEGHILEPLL